ncbi:hypothetical protein AGMMS50230_07140 [Spirochaetia bacterium]|nr:hypothetical protein AGMMS50230_07140 [Spirochaetia bacterium]
MLLFAGCKKNKDGDSDAAALTGMDLDPGLEYATQEMIDAAFTLDFTPLSPEPEAEVETIGAANAGSQLLRPSGSSSPAGQNAGGGLRKLTDYKTEYFNPEKEAARIAAIQKAQEAVKGSISQVSADPLTVIDWGPRGFFSSTVQRPSLYVIFSEPMVPLAALGPQTSTSDVVSISPPLKGNFRWFTTSYLSFEAAEPCQPQQTYRITVNPRAASLSGKHISNSGTFSFNTETLKISRLVPGEEFTKKTRLSFPNNRVPPEAAKEISLYFNYPVAVKDIQNSLTVQQRKILPPSASSVPALTALTGFTLSQAEPAKIILHMSEPAFGSEVLVTLKAGAKSANATLGTPADMALSFQTPGPFEVQRIERIPSGGSNLVHIYFSERLRETSLAGRVRTDPPMKLGPDNLQISGALLRIYNLPVNYGDEFDIIIEKGVEDIYGRKLENPYTTEIMVPPAPPPNGDVTFLNWSYDNQKMLESQFDPRYLFEYRNVTGNSWYTLSSVKNPFNRSEENTRRFTLNTETNQRWFAEMDLKPFLSRGKGFVFFNADLELLSARYNRTTENYETGLRELKNNLVLQVTDLGLTVRSGFNRTSVVVSSLSTGKPVENALVRLISPRDIDTNTDLSAVRAFAQDRTNKEGLVTFTHSGIYGRESLNSNNQVTQIFVHAEKDGDQAVFQPQGHNTWAYNVYSRNPVMAELVEPVTFMFTDRGLYKPGEVLSFRGVDRSLAVGNYLIYRGSYTVTLETDSYRDSEVIAELDGETSEAGGFYGKITLPDDITPQPYRLVYRRTNDEGKKRESTNVPVTVAFFERLKFEASISPPPEVIYAGDTVNMNLKASYLSGGSLSGAAYEESWNRSKGWFHPPAKEAADYYFGPQNAYEGNRSLSSKEGVLGASGSAALSQKTTESPVTGAPFYYTVETRITDLSNQMIAASQSVVVHPARFYLGVSAPSTKGFPRTGQELSFNFLALTPSGVRSTQSDWAPAGSAGDKLTVEFLRDEWHMVQQEGVAGYIYDQYIRESITENKQTIQLKASGSVKFTPSKPGYYTVRLSAQDSAGRKALTEYGFYVTGRGGGYWNMNNSDEIRLTPDEEMYNPGDTAQILLQSALPGGYYLVTVEREGIYSEEVKYLEEGTTVLEIPVARNYVPVVYVSVASYSVRKGPPTHEYGSPDLDKPKGYYGVTALKVNPRVKAFSVSIEDAGSRIFRPGETVTLTLKAERNGRPVSDAELTLLAVDRGVLDLINYHVPDPISYFYHQGRFPLSVNGGDSRALLIDPVTYSIKNLAGGDAEESKMEERKDFNPTAVFEPMLKTGADGKVKVTFKLPDSLTTYRLTVFGVRGDLFALKESEIAARNRINVREVLPRRLRERDTAEAGVLITNMDNSPHKVSVSLALNRTSGNTENGLIKTQGNAFVDGTAERSITLKAGENGVVYFDVAAVKEGYVNCVFTIRSDILNERLINELYIERPYVMETITTAGTVLANVSSASEGLVIPGWADNGTGNLSVSLDATRLGLLDNAVNYLFDYPYGCLEQRSSAVLPLVIFGSYIDAFNLKTKVSNPRQAAETEIKSWGQYQRADGGFPYWPDGWPSYSDFYVSIRVAHIIALAKQKNYAVPASINTQKLASYLNSVLRTSFSWSQSSYEYAYRSYLQAYALYVISLLGEPIEASRLAEITARPDADAGSLAYAGMAYLNINRKTEAAAVGGKIRNLIRSTARGADLSDPRENDRRFYYYSYYGGKVEQLALTLEFFVRQYPEDQINGRILHSLLSMQKAGGYWDSTAVTVRILSAVDALIRAENLEQVNVNGIIALSGTELFRDSYRGLGAKPSGKTFDFKAPPLLSMRRDAVLPLTISRNGRGALYYTASLRYAIPAELQSVRDEGLGVFISYYDTDTGKELSGTVLQSGKTYRASVRLSSGRDRTYVALRAPVPSGAEILDGTFVTTPRYSENQNSYESGEGGDYWEDSWEDWEDPRQPSNMVIMDNEIRYFWDHFSKGEVTVSFLFRCSRRGVYPTPPVQAECMYEGEIFGRTRGLLYTIE